MTNSKIEKVKKDIAKTKNIIAEYQKKLRDLERQKIEFENIEIIALYRNEKLNGDDFSNLAALLRSQRENESADETAANPKEAKSGEFY